MKSRFIKTMTAILAISVLSLLGCRTVVTDVNAVFEAKGTGEELGIPVINNENYIQVAYNPSDEVKVDSNEDISKDDAKEDISKEEDVKEKEDLRETEKETGEENKKEDKDSDTPDEKKDKAEDKEDKETDKQEDLKEEKEEKNEAETADDTTEKKEDLNASMASDHFDSEFYANTYPDVVAAFGNSPEALYKHYCEYGKAEGRSCNAEEFSMLNENSE